MSNTRIAIYVVIALSTMLFVFYLLSQKPPEGWPINLIHLLIRD